MRLYLGLLCLLIGACYPTRFAIYNLADYKDHQKFPSAPISASESGVELPTASQYQLQLPPSVRFEGEKVLFEEAIEKSGTLAFLVLKGDSVVHEAYYQQYQSGSIVTSFSVAKSYVSALVGISIERGELPSVETTISSFFPEVAPEELEGITIEHLLNMRSGLLFNESYFNPFTSDVAKYYYSPHVDRLLSKIRSNPDRVPGERFNYISLDTQLLGEILERVTGRPLNQLLEERIWQPMGCTHAATWSMDSRKHKQIKAFAGINAIPRDFARLGVLYLNKGRWNGKQIVPREWVERSEKFSTSKEKYRYSYQWWHDKDGAFNAEGILGQFISVHPDEDLVIVRFGKKYGGIYWESLFREIAALNAPQEGYSEISE